MRVCLVPEKFCWQMISEKWGIDMYSKLLGQLGKIAKNIHRGRSWKKVVSVLACAVVFLHSLCADSSWPCDGEKQLLHRRAYTY